MSSRIVLPLLNMGKWTLRAQVFHCHTETEHNKLEAVDYKFIIKSLLERYSTEINQGKSRYLDR